LTNASNGSIIQSSVHKWIATNPPINWETSYDKRKSSHNRFNKRRRRYLGRNKSTGAAVIAAANSNAVIDEKIKTLKTLGVKTLGDTRKDANAQALKDYFVGNGVKATTAKNYLSDVRFAFENNAPFVFNAKRAETAKGKTAQKGKGNDTAEKSDAKKMIATLLNVWKLSDAAADILIEIETAMAPDENGDIMPLIDAIADVLQAHGEKLDGEE
jgi:hypothetical protein